MYIRISIKIKERRSKRETDLIRMYCNMQMGSRNLGGATGPQVPLPSLPQLGWRSKCEPGTTWSAPRPVGVSCSDTNAVVMTASPSLAMVSG